MTASELANELNRLNEAGRIDADMTVCVQVIGRIGGSGVPIKAVAVGFDWDKGKLMLYPSRPLRQAPADPEAAE